MKTVFLKLFLLAALASLGVTAARAGDWNSDCCDDDCCDDDCCWDSGPGIRLLPVTFTTIHFYDAQLNETTQSGGELIVGPDHETLFGTGYNGGAHGYGGVHGLKPIGNGLFQYIPTYSFFGGPDDGGNPYATLVNFQGTLLGTVQTGGVDNFGAIFAIVPGTMPTFNKVADFTDAFQSTPQSKLSYLRWAPSAGLFGTSIGTDTDYGSVFKFTYPVPPAPQPALSDILKFSYQGWGEHPIRNVTLDYISTRGLTHPDGVTPNDATNLDLSRLIIYGVTRSGGSNNWGTVFKVQADTNGYQTLHAFNLDGTDGATPEGGMILRSNILYGTTASGGTNSSGTVFAIHTDGTGYHVLANFSYSTTGSSPQSDLILVGRTLYGTTYVGGTNGGGTVFAVNIDGSNFRILHSFFSPAYNGSGSYTNSDGGWPAAGLLHLRGTLYGTTAYGGPSGGGTAFAISLGLPPRLRIGKSTNSPGALRLSWSASGTNFVLQSTASLTSPKWTNVSASPTNNGFTISVKTTPGSAPAFFRLVDAGGM